MVSMETVEELAAYIADKLQGDYDYNTHVEAIADITKAAFDFSANKLGASGFSASYAELLFIQASRRLKGPFAIVKAEDMLYPQYDIENRTSELYEQWLPWAVQEAKKLLAENETAPFKAADSVVAHWRWLAEHEE